MMIMLCIKHDGKCPQCTKEKTKKVVSKNHLLHQLNSGMNSIFKALTFCDQNRFGECTEEISRAINKLRNALETIENNEIGEE